MSAIPVLWPIILTPLTLSLRASTHIALRMSTISSSIEASSISTKASVLRTIVKTSILLMIAEAAVLWTVITEGTAILLWWGIGTTSIPLRSVVLILHPSPFAVRDSDARKLIAGSWGEAGNLA